MEWFCVCQIHKGRNVLSKYIKYMYEIVRENKNRRKKTKHKTNPTKTVCVVWLSFSSLPCWIIKKPQKSAEGGVSMKIMKKPTELYPFVWHQMLHCGPLVSADRVNCCVSSRRSNTAGKWSWASVSITAYKTSRVVIAKQLAVLEISSVFAS